jgi:MraZ protein
MLIGRFYTQISEKGRVALPSKFRKETGNRIVVARWYENCLVIVGALGWNELLTRFAKKEEVVTRPIRSVERFILSTAFEIETDEQGRFVIPQTLRDIAQLRKEVLFIGLGERIELWDKDTWEEEELKVKEEADKMLEEVVKQRREVNKK